MSKHQAHPSGVFILALIAGSASLIGCGGGSSAPAAGGNIQSPPIPVGTAKASILTALSGKTAWNLNTLAKFSLIDSTGANVSTALTCSSDDPVALEVSADCSSIKGMRLGLRTVTVTSGSVSAKASVKVIPQAQPLATNHSPFNLVVTPDGRVLAWGVNSREGALGQGKMGTDLPGLFVPTAVKTSTGVLGGIVAASAGVNTAMALTEDGEVYSWGNEYLGRPAQNGDTLPGKVTDPTGNASLNHIVSVSMGNNNALALADDGTVYSWGNWSGQAGPDPKKVPGVVSALAGKAVSVSAGDNWSSALLADGRVMAWGFSSNNGVLGRPRTSDAMPPGFVVEQSTGQAITGVVSLSAGYNFGMALNAAGQIYAWGDNSWGQLGQNTRGNFIPGAVLVKAPSGASIWSGVAMVAAGGNHALALDNNGQVFSWGYAQNGELGDGANHPRLNDSPLPAAVVNAAGIGQLGSISAIASGGQHSLALTSDGNVLNWGLGFRGVLGQGAANTNISYVPLLVHNEAESGALSLGPTSYWQNLKHRDRP